MRKVRDGLCVIHAYPWIVGATRRITVQQLVRIRIPRLDTRQEEKLDLQR